MLNLFVDVYILDSEMNNDNRIKNITRKKHYKNMIYKKSVETTEISE